MRTTLKRGIARAGTNGHAAFPPSALTPVARYEAGRRSPLRIVGKILLSLLVALFVAAGALGGGFYLYINHSLAAVGADTSEAREAQKALDVPVPGQPAIAMVIGYDKRLGKDKGNPARSDTIMLVRADPQQETISMLSFPRDLVAEIPACRGRGAYRDRINEAFTACGPRGTLETVRKLTGVRINYMVTVNFRGFKQIVNRLGGVYMDVDRRYFNNNAGRGPGEKYATIDLHPGYQRLNGSRALDFVRYRHTDSDIYRNARQQEFVKAVKQQVESLWSVRKLPGIVNAITNNVEIGVGGGKPLDPETLYGYAKLVYELPAGNFHQARIDGLREAMGESGAYLLEAPEEEVEAAVQKFVMPDAAAAEKATAVATGKKPKVASAPPPASVAVEVRNGNGVAGSADEAAFALAKRGYRAVNGGNADRFDYFHTTILYDPANPEGRAAAAAVGALFGDAEIQEAPPAAGLETMLRVVVGKTFHGKLGPGPTDTTPDHKPPAVVRDTASIAPAIKRARRKADFPLLVPTVREKTSVLDDEEGLRVYDLEGHRALRLVYRTGANEYWGIQQTTWTEAPILASPTLTRTIGGREYRLYFAASHLHVVAFEEGGAAYWVVNTLLNSLSNETMLAIAKGLKPLKSK